MKKYILPYIIFGFYFLLSRSWRYVVAEHPEFTAARRNGTPIIFAFWHGDEMAVLRCGPRYRCAAMVSTSDDGEMMSKILKLFGFGVSRGSSTRGGVRALVGMIQLVRQGFSATVAVDGPKGPRHKVKPGIVDLTKHVEGAIIPTGVASSNSYVFKKSWNLAHLPLPFAKVVVSFGRPVESPLSTDSVEVALQAQGLEAHKLL